MIRNSQDLQQLIDGRKIDKREAETLLNQLAAVRELVQDTESAVNEFGDETVRRLNAITEYVAHLPQSLRDRLQLNLLEAKTLRDQLQVLEDFDRATKFYEKQDTIASEQSAAAKTNQIRGIMLGLIAGLSLSIAAVPFMQTTDDRAALDIGGNIAAVTGLMTAGGYFWTLPNQGKKRRS